MQRSAPTNPATLATSLATSNYYDPFIYTKDLLNPIWQQSIGVTDANTNVFVPAPITTTSISPAVAATSSPHRRFRPSAIRTALFALFEAQTRMAVARRCPLPGRRREQDRRAVQPGEDAADERGPSSRPRETLARLRSRTPASRSPSRDRWSAAGRSRGRPLAAQVTEHPPPRAGTGAGGG